jgi:hypothetical protein
MNVSAIAVRASVTSLVLQLVAVFVISMGFALVYYPCTGARAW